MLFRSAVTGRATLDSAIEAVESRSAGYILKPVDVTRLSAIVARVFGRRRLARENKQSQERLEVLHDVSRRLAAVHDPEEVLTVIVNEAAGLLGAEAAGLRLLEGDDLVVGARTESAAGVMARPRLKVGESLSGLVVAAGEPLVVEDLAEDRRHDPAHKLVALERGFRGFVGVPLRTHVAHLE